MATNAYMTGRKKYARPQAMLWSENQGNLENGLYAPIGYEVGAVVPEGTDASLEDQFIVLSDHNRSAIDFSTQRIERRERMINGRMRSYHIADKLSVSLSWTNLPSRAFKESPNFSEAGKTELSPYSTNKREPLLNDPNARNYAPAEQYTVDGGAGGIELLEWYDNHQGSFWVYMGYDKYTNFAETDPQRYSKLGQYNQVLEMFISSFDYSIVRRGSGTHDLWDITVSLEEV